MSTGSIAHGKNNNFLTKYDIIVAVISYRESPPFCL